MVELVKLILLVVFMQQAANNRNISQTIALSREILLKAGSQTTTHVL
jgi:hypothetical protein